MTPARGAHFRVLSNLLRSFGAIALSPRTDVARHARSARAWSIASAGGAPRALWVLGPAQGYGGASTNVELVAPRRLRAGATRSRGSTT